MPDIRRRALPLAAALTLALALPAAASAEACSGLGRNFVICPAGTPWDSARWNQFGDGAALESNGYSLEFTESWAGRRNGDTLDAALDNLLAEFAAEELAEGYAAPGTLLRDSFDTGALQVVRAIIEVQDDDGADPFLMATMIAESRDLRIMLMLSHDDDIALADLDATARAVAALVRPAQEG